MISALKKSSDRAIAAQNSDIAANPSGTAQPQAADIPICTINHDGVILGGNRAFDVLRTKLSGGGQSRFLGGLLGQAFDFDDVLLALANNRRVDKNAIRLGNETRPFYSDLSFVPAQDPYEDKYYSVFFYLLDSNGDYGINDPDKTRTEIVRDLVSGTFHDYNNIFSIITGYCQLMLMENMADEKQKAMIHTILRAADRAADVSKRILDINRTQPEEINSLDLVALVEEIGRTLKRMLGENIIVKMSMQEQQAWIRTSRSDLILIITGLVMHAKKLMPKGGVIEIEVSLGQPGDNTWPDHSEGQYHKLMITNYGVEQASRAREYLFAPLFLRGEGKNEQEISVAHLLNDLKSYGANAELNDAGDGQVSYVIHFPVKKSEASVPRAEHQENALVQGNGELILVVEDDPQVRSLVRHVLRKCNYTVIDASNAGEAKLLIEKYNYKPDLLLCDVILPLMNGVELAADFAASLPAMKILFMSGYPNDKLPSHKFSSEQLIQKPILPKALSRTIRATLDSN